MACALGLGGYTVMGFACHYGCFSFVPVFQKKRRFCSFRMIFDHETSRNTLEPRSSSKLFLSII